MITIWGRASSQNVQKVLWCCEELELPFARIDWGGAFGGNDDPEYRRMNPNGRVPTIKVGDDVVWESNTILRYLCARNGAEHLYPADPYRRSEVDRWCDWQLSALNPPMVTLLIGYIRTAPADRDMQALETARVQALAQWAILEKQLARHPYLAGDDFTLADIGNGILVHRWHAYPIERPDFPRLAQWYARLAERSGFRNHVAGPVS